jgi:hypothetical protein
VVPTLRPCSVTVATPSTMGAVYVPPPLPATVKVTVPVGVVTVALMVPTRPGIEGRPSVGSEPPSGVKGSPGNSVER